jgi:hypothetical protein
MNILSFIAFGEIKNTDKLLKYKDVINYFVKGRVK